ncbi:MAG: hypothetical protein IH996_08225 [Proteobacteria bacterium]|nr:hypothetical protein [Pseudomonadota bacterium]
MNGFGLRGFRSRRALAVLIGAIALPVGLWGCDGENTVELAPPEVLAPHIYAEVIDLRGRFREIYCQIKEDHGADFAHDFACHQALHLWPGEPAGTGQPVPTGEAGFQGPILVVPGIFGECIADHVKPFELALSHLNQAHGYETGIISVSGRSSSEHNANQIRLDLESRNLGGDRQAILIGYSKGTTDILEALIRHPEISEKVAAVVAVAGVVSGSPAADEMGEFFELLASTIDLPNCPAGDGGGINSLRQAVRVPWLADNPLPESIEYFSIPAFTSKENVSLILRDGYKKLAQREPRNDSQMIIYDAVIPGSRLLGYANGDHWSMALAFTANTPILAQTLITKNAFPREVLLEAIVRSVEEVLDANRP